MSFWNRLWLSIVVKSKAVLVNAHCIILRTPDGQFHSLVLLIIESFQATLEVRLVMNIHHAKAHVSRQFYSDSRHGTREIAFISLSLQL